MTTLLSNKRAMNGILTAVLILFSVTLWKADDFLVEVSCCVAILGWVALWQERTSEKKELASETSPAMTPAGVSSPSEKIPSASRSTVAAPGEEVSDSRSPASNQTAPATASSSVARETGERAEPTLESLTSSPGSDETNLLDDLIVHPAPTSDEIEVDLTEVEEQIRTARVETEKAVGVAIGSFGSLVEQARQLEECSQEVAQWQTDSNPLRQSTLEYLVQCSRELGACVNQLVMAFQFNDLLSQRLSHTENSLDHLKGRIKGEKRSAMRKKLSFTTGPVEYTAPSQEEEMVTLF